LRVLKFSKCAKLGVGVRKYERDFLPHIKRENNEEESNRSPDLPSIPRCETLISTMED
jgi:hypothetical protein